MDRCDPSVPNVTNAATVNDFIIAYTLVEAVELSNLDSGGTAIDCIRLNKALTDAYIELMADKLLMTAPSAAVVDLNLNRWMLIIARYLLDTVRRRGDVVDDYKSLKDKLKDMYTKTAAGQRFNVSATYGKTARFTEKGLSNYTNRILGQI